MLFTEGTDFCFYPFEAGQPDALGNPLENTISEAFQAIFYLSGIESMGGEGKKMNEEHLISVYFTVEGKKGAAAAVIPESYFRLAFCCQNHSFTTVCHSHMVPSTSGPQRNLQTVTITAQEM